MPSAFSNAWLLILIYLICDPGRYSLHQNSGDKLMEQCNVLIDAGMAEILLSLAPSPLHEKTALQPRGVMALIIKRLIEDVVGDSPDVLSTYSSYMDELVSTFEYGTTWTTC